MSRHALRFLAGPGAMEMIRKEGFQPGQIGTIAGASGGAKWLVLSRIDRVIAERILPSLHGPVHLLGSSIGSWRFACYAQADPAAAIARFEEAYLEQRYSEKPDAAEISRMTAQILDRLLGADGVAQILGHPVLRTSIMTVRAHSVAASERRMLLAAVLLAAATANAISRRSLGVMFSRALFYDPRDLPPIFDAAGFPMERTPLATENLRDAILATGAIPLVLNGVRNIEGAHPGMYRDGGIIDYHLDLPTSAEGRLTLYPHFFGQLKPGWFDKKLPWRRHDPANLDRTLLIHPSAEFIARLPNAKVPDRRDFATMAPEHRRKVWRAVVEACNELADELTGVLDRQLLPARLEPLC